MMPIQMTVPGHFDAAAGDLWRVASVGANGVTLERVAAPPGTYRKPGDGLHPRVPAPDTRPISDAEAKAINDQMDAALDAERDKLRAWAFSPDNPLNARDCPAHDTRCRPGACILAEGTASPRSFGGK